MNNKKFSELINTENKKKLIKILINESAESRVEIAKELNVSTASISKISEALINNDLIEEVGSIDQGKIGRKQIKLQIKSNQFLSIGIEVHSNYITFIVVDLNKNILESKSIQFEKLEQEHIDILIDNLQDIKVRYDETKILGWGLLLQGIIKNGESISLPIKDINKQIRDKVGVITFVENNIKGLAIAENFSKPNDVNYLFVRYGPGIGGVLSINGEVQNGLRNRAGEIGHVRYNHESKNKCPICNQYGCLESEINLNRIYKEKYNSHITSHDQINETFIKENYNKLLEYTSILARALSQAIDIIDPDYLLVAGKIFDNEQIFKNFVDEINRTKEINYLDRIKKIENYSEKVKLAPALLVISNYLNTN